MESSCRESIFHTALSIRCLRGISSILYGDTTLSGYFVSADSTDEPRRTIIFNGGYNSTMSERWLAIRAAALARGYNFLAFNGPGQGAAVRQQHLYFRPDWKSVLTPVINYALTRTNIDPRAMVILGWGIEGVPCGTRGYTGALCGPLS